MSFLVGGGVEGFTSESARESTDVGGTWEARLGFGTRSLIGFEAAYVGTAQDIDALGLDRDATLTSHGFEGDVRLNLSSGMVQPYIFTGAGLRHYAINNAEFNLSDINDSDNVIEIPMGVGLTYRLSPAIVDFRGVFRSAFDNDLIKSNSLNTWSARVNVGWEF